MCTVQILGNSVQKIELEMNGQIFAKRPFLLCVQQSYQFCHRYMTQLRHTQRKTIFVGSDSNWLYIFV